VTDSHSGPPLVLASGPGDDGVAVLALNRPEKKSALSIALREEAAAILGRLADDAALKVLVVPPAHRLGRQRARHRPHNGARVTQIREDHVSRLGP